ncbi:hypothetical protein M231_01628 [Tremella mesenterica]|uniref:Rhodanese domain-containing protein n=1 Tax=Tremella mesenterica TaxID=5217 RepID=A0A4Q1BSR0_TREME|nr:hypothetical protein M231_01628 [Tremella mesenterica]
MSFSLPYAYITARELATMIKASPSAALKDYAVVDVRGDDFVGGNIVSALNYPSETFHDNVSGLVERLKTVPKVIFHCALSQARGPKAARIYAESRASLVPTAPPQQILVLRDGFSGFQALYRVRSRLSQFDG